MFANLASLSRFYILPNLQVICIRRKAWSLLTPETLYETSFQKLELVLTWATFHFVGWVEPTQDFVGFRCTQPNLHFAGFIANCGTQQRPISEPSPKSFFSDQTGRPPEAGKFFWPAAALTPDILYFEQQTREKND